MQCWVGFAVIGNNLINIGRTLTRIEKTIIPAAELTIDCQPFHGPPLIPVGLTSAQPHLENAFP
jgi:hypothetical protein